MSYRAVITEKKGPWATFRLGREMFAVSAEDIQEVMMQQPLTPVPLAPSYIVGLLNLRGQIMPAVDLRRRLNFPPNDQEQESIFLVLKIQDSLVSVIVDGVGDVLDLSPNSWENVPETLNAGHRHFFFGIHKAEKNIVLGLRVESIGEDHAINKKS